MSNLSIKSHNIEIKCPQRPASSEGDKQSLSLPTGLALRSFCTPAAQRCSARNMWLQSHPLTRKHVCFCRKRRIQTLCNVCVNSHPCGKFSILSCRSSWGCAETSGKTRVRQTDRIRASSKSNSRLFVYRCGSKSSSGDLWLTLDKESSCQPVRQPFSTQDVCKLCCAVWNISDFNLLTDYSGTAASYRIDALTH